MLYGKFYVFEQRYGRATPETNFDIYSGGGMHRHFLITETHLPEFKKLLKKLDQPLYGLSPRRDRLSGGPLTNFYQAVKKYTQLQDEKIHILLIPTGLLGTSLPVIHDGDKVQMSNLMMRSGITIDRAMLYDAHHPSGHMDPELVDNPLGMLKKLAPRVSSAKLAGVNDIARVLWNSRGELTMTPYTKNWEGMKLDDMVNILQTF